MSKPLLSVSRLTRRFELGAETVVAVTEVSFELDRGEALAVTGPSGSGKSTLLHLIGTLDRPSSGSIRIGGIDPSALPEPELARFRNHTIGFVFQEHHLLPQYTLLENALLPALAFRGDLRAARKRARALLERVGLGHRLGHRPAELSGGERQRAAVARALVNEPSLVLCDEPTGSLDAASARSVTDLIFELHAAGRGVLVVVTHSLELAARFERRLELSSLEQRAT